MKNEIAILVAAGNGSRMLPLTEIIPKPLIKVHEKPMIETNIEALQHRGVDTIYIVIGYKKEQFYYLKEKYKNIVFVENKEFAVKNNMSSIHALGDILGTKDCFISDADLYIGDKDVYLGDFVNTCFFAKFVKEKTEEWFYETQGNCITKLVKGGENGYNMADISYWKKEDACRIKEYIHAAYVAGDSDNLLWEQVVAKHFKDLSVCTHRVKEGQITELDTVDELRAFDPKYKDE